MGDIADMWGNVTQHFRCYVGRQMNSKLDSIVHSGDLSRIKLAEPLQLLYCLVGHLAGAGKRKVHQKLSHQPAESFG